MRWKVKPYLILHFHVLLLRPRLLCVSNFITCENFKITLNFKYHPPILSLYVTFKFILRQEVAVYSLNIKCWFARKYILITVYYLYFLTTVSICLREMQSLIIICGQNCDFFFINSFLAIPICMKKINCAQLWFRENKINAKRTNWKHRDCCMRNSNLDNQIWKIILSSYSYMMHASVIFCKWWKYRLSKFKNFTFSLLYYLKRWSSQNIKINNIYSEIIFKHQRNTKRFGIK